MNIFYLDNDPAIAAQKTTLKKHIVKMILESAQLLCGAHRALDDQVDPTMYRLTHKNHPSAKWVRESAANYRWVYEYMLHLANIYEDLYGREHLCITKLAELLQQPPMNIDHDAPFTQPPQCMPDEYKVAGDAVAGYTNYYKFKQSVISN